ncbi:hypothetical protein LJC22_03715 [Desulfosarcina sp. OttesenSCG-928-G10]|nr:hypothetical protein [Desulfosarcina sp. OttesenSCG-928-G10]
MIHYYTNREISEKLSINPARWKRWSRVFLPPDPLGGMQSGYARQYLYGDLFIVFLGGHLLTHHKQTVPEARQVISDLTSWMKKTGFLDLKKKAQQESGVCIRVFFYLEAATKTGFAFRYLIQKSTLPVIDPERSATGKVDSIVHPAAILSETVLGKEPENPVQFYQNPDTSLLNLSALADALITRLAAGKGAV